LRRAHLTLSLPTPQLQSSNKHNLVGFMFSKLFGKKKPAPQTVVVAHLNAKVQPIQRGDIFEDPLDAILKHRSLGENVGGGTAMAPAPYGIASCDIEIALHDASDATLSLVIAELEALGAPKGSSLQRPDGAPIAFGQLEGMAIFLNGTDLPDDVYAASDVNRTVAGLNAALSGKGGFMGHWEGPAETALYFYGKSYAQMQTAAEAFSATDPLCSLCRFEQIA
jgi:hypothetical protein